MESLSPGAIAASAGLIAGMGFGFASRWGNFCTLGSIEDAIFGGNLHRLRMWGVAIAISMFGTFLLDQLGLIDITSTFYLDRPTTLIATAIGSLIFGIGMSLVGTCGFGALARMGGGDLKSVVTFLIMGITAYATLSGATAYLRVGLFPDPPEYEMPAGLAQYASSQLGGTTHLWAYGLAVLILLLAVSSRSFLAKPRNLITGCILGAMVIWGWYATGVLAADDFEPYPLESLTFAAPLGETLMYAMTMTGSSLQFGIGATVGVVIGATITTLGQGYFRWEASDDARELRRQMMGGLLMGFGSVTALGCTVGQGMSAMSALAFSAPVALFFVFCGAWLGLHFLVHGSITEAFHHLMAKREKNQ